MSFIIQQREAIEADRNRERADRMAQVVERFASRLNLRPIRVRVAPSGVAPAWSTSNTISFNAQTLGDLSDPTVAIATRGLALHEIAHQHFTPRAGTDLVQWVLATRLGRAFNALEDQRIETLMVGRYGEPVVDWFIHVIAQHLLDSADSVPYLFPLIRGRKYLPVEVRNAVRQAYVNQQDVAELSAIVDEYRTLLFPEDTERAKVLIQRYHALVKQAGQPESGEGQGEPQGDGGWSNVKDPNGHDRRQAGEHESGDSRPMSKSQQKQAKAKAEAREEQAEDEFDFGDGDSDWDEPEDENEAESGQPSDSPADDAGNGDADGDADGSSEADASDAGDADGDSDSNEASDSPAKSNGAGEGGSEPESLTDLLGDILEQVGERLAEQANDAIKQFNGEATLEGERVAKPKQAEHRTATPTADAIAGSKAFLHELERLRADNDPNWEPNVSSGRINAQRYLTGAPLDEVFDRWSEGREDVTDIEAVILLDTSGSMQSNSEASYNAMWALKRALDKVGASTTVLTFAYQSKVLYSSDEQASSTIRNAGVGGGTSPLQGIKYAKDVLANSDRKVKLFFTITDGQWSEAEECDNLITKLRQANVLTALAFITGGYDAHDSLRDISHGCEVSATIRSGADLFSLGRQLVRVATTRNLALAS